MKKNRLALALAVVACAGTAATAQSLTTTISNNGNGGVFMDLTPNVPLNITSFESYFSGSTASTIEVWIRPGTYVGFDASNAGWTLHEIVLTTGAGSTALAPIPLVNPIPAPDGITTAVYLQGVSGATLAYTGTASNPPQTLWANADLSLFSDVARTGSVSFGGTRNSPRTFAGVVHYMPSGPATPGACCFADGTCQVLLGSECFTQGGSFQGGNTDCATTPCPQPAACCFPNGSCDVMLESACTLQGGQFNATAATCLIANCPQPQVGACCLPAGCQVISIFDCQAQGGLYQGDTTTCAAGPCSIYHFETEPNNTKPEANHIILSSGHAIVGTSTASTGTADPASPDYYRIQTEAAAPGIYRHRMSLNNEETPGGSAWIRAVSQTAVPAGTWPCSVGTQGTTADSAGQTHVLEGTTRVNYWYGFGKEEQVYYRVSGVASTTGMYVAALTTEPVMPTDLGGFQSGDIVISTANQGHTNDTSLRIYDSNFEPIEGYANDRGSINGGHTANSSNVSYLHREYLPGTYYMALTIGTLSTDQGAPCDDNIRTGVMADFAGVAFNVGTATTTDVSFTVTDANGPVAFVASREGTRQIAWYTFTVSGVIETGACCFASGACEQLTDASCTSQGGTYQGVNTDCAVVNCPQPPTGACCLPMGDCVIDWETGCLSQGGMYFGDNSTCEGRECPVVIIFPQLPHAGANTIPFSQPPGITMHQVYSSDQFAAISGGEPIEISRMAFSSTNTGTVTGHLVIRLGYTNALGGVLAAAGGLDIPDIGGGGAPNAIGPMHEFFSGPINHTGDGDIESFDFVFDGTPFIYDPTLGNLLEEIYITDQGGSLSITRAAGGPLGSRVYHRHQGTTSSLTAQAHRVRMTFSIVDESCYANCDGSTTEPILNVDDFTCFINEFATSLNLSYEQQVASYANCDGSTLAPVLNVDDFTCFINAFAAGCP